MVGELSVALNSLLYSGVKTQPWGAPPEDPQGKACQSNYIVIANGQIFWQGEHFLAPLQEHVAVIQCFGFACGEIVQVHLQVQLRLVGMSKYWNKCNFDGRSAKIQFTLKGVYQLKGFGGI